MNLREIRKEVMNFFPIAKENYIKTSLRWAKDELKLLKRHEGILVDIDKRIDALEKIIKYLEELE